MCYTLSAEKILLNYFASKKQSNRKYKGIGV